MKNAVQTFGGLVIVICVITTFVLIWAEEKELPFQIILTCVLLVIVTYFFDQYLEEKS